MLFRSNHGSIPPPLLLSLFPLFLFFFLFFSPYLFFLSFPGHSFFLPWTSSFAPCTIPHQHDPLLPASSPSTLPPSPPTYLSLFYLLHLLLPCTPRPARTSPSSTKLHRALPAPTILSSSLPLLLILSPSAACLPSRPLPRRSAPHRPAPSLDRHRSGPSRPSSCASSARGLRPSSGHPCCSSTASRPCLPYRAAVPYPLSAAGLLPLQDVVDLMAPSSQWGLPSPSLQQPVTGSLRLVAWTLFVSPRLCCSVLPQCCRCICCLFPMVASVPRSPLLSP